MKKKLKIGVMIAGEFTIPRPRGVIYAPMVLAKSIAENLTRKGHKVYFFAPRGSRLKVTKIISGDLEPFRIASGKNGSKIISNPRLKSILDRFVGGQEINKILSLWDQYLISLAYEMAIEKNWTLSTFIQWTGRFLLAWRLKKFQLSILCTNRSILG